MANLQEVFARLEENKRQQRDIKRAYRDALDNVQEYHEIKEELQTLKERKKQIENTVKDDFSGEFSKLETLKIDIAADKELLSDIALNTYAKGELVKVKDDNETEYEPIFTVKFQKVK